MTVALDTSAAVPLVVATHPAHAVYDALVALAVREADAELLTRDARAAATYAALRVRFRLIA